MKNSTIAEAENPFTIIGLLTAIIHDLNNLRQKVELVEKDLISQNIGNSIVKEDNKRADSRND